MRPAGEPPGGIARFAAITALLALVAVVGVTAAPAAGRPCWQSVLRDWRDRDLGSYPVQCYRQALARMPADLEIYSSAPEDIRRALARHIARRPAFAQASPVSSSGPASREAGPWKALVLAGIGATAIAFVPAAVAVYRARSRRS